MISMSIIRSLNWRSCQKKVVRDFHQLKVRALIAYLCHLSVKNLNPWKFLILILVLRVQRGLWSKRRPQQLWNPNLQQKNNNINHRGQDLRKIHLKAQAKVASNYENPRRRPLNKWPKTSCLIFKNRKVKTYSTRMNLFFLMILRRWHVLQTLLLCIRIILKGHWILLINLGFWTDAQEVIIWQILR